jgi:excisionase family DNA binding protein
MIDKTNMPSTEATLPRLALRPREAARALGISPRKLWQLTNCGEIPCTRIGRCVVYPVDVLREWLAEQAAKGGRR